MLVIEDLKVELAGKVILKHIDLEIKPGEVHVLFGPNGSGKTSLLMTIMGYPQYKVLSGKIFFKGVDITNLPINERAKLGIGMSFQKPPTIRGLKTRQMIKICAGGRDIDIEGLAKSLKFSDFLERDVNDGFSGGEIKRCELLQLLAQDPDLMLFDEPESGVDLENMELIGKMIATALGQSVVPKSDKTLIQQKRERKKMGLIITHTGHILDYVSATKGQVLFDGVMSCAENPREILKCISQMGYEECIRCIIGNNLGKEH